MTRVPVCDPFAPEGPGRAFLVAEIGNNHEGDVADAREMVRAAAAAGADAVKVRTFRTELFIHPSDAERTERMRRFQLTTRDFTQLAEEARRVGLRFISTPLDLPSADALAPLVWAYKIASGDNDFVPLLERVARSGKPVIVSTGASDLADVDRTASTLRAAKRLAMLHCVSAYPAPANEVNLRAMTALRERFPDVAVGYSDHTLGIETCIAAATLGARIIEKHFTLDKNHSAFRDHQLSAEPDEMRALASALDHVALMLGSTAKTVQPSESASALAIRRSVFLSRDVPTGRALVMEDLVWLRPGDGIPASRTREVLGRMTARPLRAGDKLSFDDLRDS
jgi:N,N'-diacetyllegionaminate synthase